MPHRAITSTLVILIGTLSGSAAPITTSSRNTAFQPRPTLNTTVLKPAQARILGGEQRTAFHGQNTIPIWQSPAGNKLNRVVFGRLAGDVMQPAVIKAAGGG